MATLRDSQGRLFDVDDAEAAAAIQGNPELTPASAEDIAAYDASKAREAEFGTAGQQALAGAESVVRTATFGALPGLPGHEQREAEFREQSPFVSMGTQALGAVAPALLTGGIAGGAAGAVGLGARSATAATVVGEGLGAGLAEEVEQARFERRQVSAGNVLLYGLGGELVGRAVPALARRGLRSAMDRVGDGAQAAAREAVGLTDGVDNLLVSSERRAQRSALDNANDLPAGPARDEFLVSSEKELLDGAATRTAAALDAVRKDFAELGDVTIKPKRIEPLISRTSPEHAAWATETRVAALDLRDRIRGLDSQGNPTGPAMTEGLGQIGHKINNALARFSEELGEASTAKEWFLAADRAKRQVQKFRSTLARGSKAAHDALGAVLGEFGSRLRLDLEDGARWGKAAELQKAVNAAWADRYLKGASVAEQDLGRRVGKSDYQTGDIPHRYDPGKVRNFMRSDQVGRGLTPEHLDQVLAGAEDMLAAHKRFGTADAAQLERLAGNIERVRADVKLADETQLAKNRVSEAAAARKVDERTSRAQEARSELFGDVAIGAVGAIAGALGGGWAGAAVAGTAKLMRYWRLTNTLAAASDAASKSAARGAVRGTAKQIAPVIDSALAKLPKAAVPAMATALSRFTGDYPDAQSSFEAKRKAIELAQGDPILLATALSSSMGELPSIDPVLFADIAGRMTTAVDYAYRNLPPQVSISLTHPNGIPLSRQALRDTAQVWNSVFMPSTVLEDVSTGMVSPKQIAAFKAVHPDRYAKLCDDLQAEIAQNFSDVPTQRKLKWDMILGSEGAAGKAYGSTMARAAADYRARQRKEAERAGPMPQTSGATGAQSAKAISTIGAGVTSAG